MLKHTFRARGDLEDRVVIHPQGSAPDGYVLVHPLEGEEAIGDIVVEGRGEAGYMLEVESLRAYSEYLDESVEELPDPEPAEVGEVQEDQVEARKEAVAESGSEGQVDANALGDLSDAGEASATEARAARRSKRNDASEDAAAADAMANEGGNR